LGELQVCAEAGGVAAGRAEAGHDDGIAS